MGTETKMSRLNYALQKLKTMFPEIAKHSSIQDENGEPALRIRTYGTDEQIILTFDESLGKYWANGFQSAGGMTVAPENIERYFNVRCQLLLNEARPKVLLRRGLVAAGIAGAVLFACGKSKAEEPPQVPEQDQSVATQMHLEP